MANGPRNDSIERDRTAVPPLCGADLSDGQLLERFIGQRDQAAFAALVRRHGPMVWGVCRRVLRSYQDAEDAFQAAFFVLVKKAASVMPRDLVGNWLHGVAHQTALKARATAAKRKGRERQVTELPETAVEEQAPPSEWGPLLDRELTRLPDKYRAAIVLCDLEGRTQKEAARQLRLPEGTLSGHLYRGRAMLAKRLARHGAVLSGAALAASLSELAASACPPAALSASTIQAAGLIASGCSAAAVTSGQAVALAEKAVKAMWLTKLKIATSLVLLAVLFCGVIGVRAHHGTAQGPGEPEAPAAQAAPMRPLRFVHAHLVRLHEAVRPHPGHHEPRD